jgi:hypothetical protein
MGRKPGTRSELAIQRDHNDSATSADDQVAGIGWGGRGFEYASGSHRPPGPGAAAASRRRGPRTLWIVVLAAILVLGVIVTIAPVISSANAAPTVTFASGVPAVVIVDDQAAEPRIYLSAAQPGRAERGVLDGPAREGSR